MAPIDLAWDVAVAADGSRGFHGTVTLTVRSGPGRVTAGVIGVDGAVATGATTFAYERVAAGQRIDLPVNGLTAAAVGRPGGITVSVAYTTSDTRGRAVRIDLQDPAQAAAQKAADEAAKPDAAAPVGDSPLQGVHVIRDASGERLILQPSTPPANR